MVSQTNPILRIMYVSGQTAAFTIHGEVYYLQVGPDLPQLYTRNLQKLIVPNLDNWFQAQTHQRYSYRGVKDMMGAFEDGLGHCYANNDLPSFITSLYAATRDVIIRSPAMREFIRAYWVELLDPKKLPRLTAEITNNFEQMQQKWGADQFFECLCRLRNYCILHAPGETSVYERLIARTGRKETDVKLVNYAFEQDIIKQLVAKLVDGRASMYKDIPQEVVMAVDALNAKYRR